MNKNYVEVHIEQLICFVEIKAESWRIPFLIGGFIGALIQRIRKPTTWTKFIGSIFMAMFVGWVVGISITSFFDFKSNFVYAICSMAGVFSQNLLDQIEKIINNLYEFVKSIINKKFGL